MLDLRIWPLLALLPAVAILPLLNSAQVSADTVAKQTGYGSNPELPAPNVTLFPTVNIAPARGWKAGEKPVATSGLAVTAYAVDLDHPRWLHVLPNGDVLVTETNAPTRPNDKKGLRNWIVGLLMSRAGAGGKSANRIILLRGLKADGSATERHVFLEGLDSPFGMALVGNWLYVANTGALVKYPYVKGDTQIKAAPVKIADLPAGEINHHWTKNVIASKDGARLFVTVGSNSNVAENGIDKEVNRAAILAVDPQSGKSTVFASGLRNPNGLAFEPESGVLWTVVNERDELGNDLVPDYLTSVREGDFYGWPYSYFGQHTDDRVKPQNPGMVQKAVVPDYALGAHTASLGLTFASGSKLSGQFANGAFIGQHGSWNRKPASGYKVIFVPFSGGKPSGDPVDVLTGFLDADGSAKGRPVGVALALDGALLVADDAGNCIWRVTVDDPASPRRDGK